MIRQDSNSRPAGRALGLFACGVWMSTLSVASNANEPLTIIGQPMRFAPDIVSTDYSEVRLTLSPDGTTALWFSRDRPGGPGGYDIWIARKRGDTWSTATPAPFNSPTRDFDPAFSPDGAYVYFCSDRAGGIGGDDVYRVRVSGEAFGTPESLGPTVNSAGNEFAPMISPDHSQLLFSSDRAGGQGAHDLYTARYREQRFEPAVPLRGEINTSANEFDAAFLSDNSTVVFARAKDFRTDRVDLFIARRHNGRYELGQLLPLSINSKDQDTYGPMLDWSDPTRLAFSTQRDGANSMDVYLIRYQLP